ncbi:hypothetical protein Agabi119p4_2677 [Agaricus bisporus var. burnettii]|uniref:Uncharacterized protein n=1 Tax=Agaricus bisporus var. burnettii TaxID=192524 RepID=A0A8H7KKB1_AGABI|nr:hypothetical protein Agabi119p4_2677 [Agaricus bisporus var. burnettii]
MVSVFGRFVGRRHFKKKAFANLLCSVLKPLPSHAPFHDTELGLPGVTSLNFCCQSRRKLTLGTMASLRFCNFSMSLR